jgi:hypothetical protein
MALYHRGRDHNRRRHLRWLHPPRLPSNHQMAQRRRAQLRLVAPDGRHQRVRRHTLAIHLGRRQALPDRLPPLPLRAHPALVHPLADVPILLPKHRADSWIWRDRDSVAHCAWYVQSTLSLSYSSKLTHHPSLVRNLPRLHRRNLVRRNHRRPQPTHLRANAVRRSRQRHRRRHHSRRSPLLRHVPRKPPPSHPHLHLLTLPQMPMGAVSSYQIIVSWVANSFPRPLVKRSSAIAIGNCVANAASIYGSYMYPSSDGPRYIPGSGANAAICLTIIGLVLVLRYVHIYENKKLERAEQEVMAGGGEVGVVDGDGDGEWVGRRAVGFRYVY